MGLRFCPDKGFYPAQAYRTNNIAYKLYRYSDNSSPAPEASASQKGKIKIVWPIPSNNRGSEFDNQEEILSHVGENPLGSI